METRANFVLIGVFTLAVVAGAFLFVLWFSGLGGKSTHSTYQVLFTGSVSGLSRGGTVLFNGLRVGEVTQMDFVPDHPGDVSALIEVEERVPIKKDTKARLELQGLTGAAAVALTGGAPDAPPLVGKNGAPPVIVAEPSQFQNILESVQHLSAKADSVLGRADKIMADNADAIGDTLKNIDAFSKALGDSSSGISSALEGIGDIGRKIGPLAGKLETLSDDADKLVKSIDPAKVSKVVGDVATFSGVLTENKDAVASLVQDAAALAKRLNATSQQLDAAVADLDKVVKSVDPGKVADVVDSADELAQTLRQNKGNVDRMVKDAAELVAKLNGSADKVDQVLTSLQNFVSSPDAKGPLTDVSDAARSIRKLADDLNVRTKDIATGLSHFTGSGLREYEALAIDGRRTVNDLDRVLRGLESNPSQLIFGSKPTLPEFQGAK